MDNNQSSFLNKRIQGLNTRLGKAQKSGNEKAVKRIQNRIQNTQNQKDKLDSTIKDIDGLVNALND